MKNLKKGIAALLASVCLTATLTLSACGVGEQMQQAAGDAISAVTTLAQGENIGQVGAEYETRWFTFTIESMEVTPSIPEYTASDGNTLVVARITETNISGSSQPFGTFDWFVDDDTLAEYIYPVELNDVNPEMMPASFRLADGETCTYDIVIEYPLDLANPFLVYMEVDDKENVYMTFKVPVK